MKITSAIITQMPRPMPAGMLDPMPQVLATFEDGSTKTIRTFDPYEVYFRASEFIGLTEGEARSLLHLKHLAVLQSEAAAKLTFPTTDEPPSTNPMKTTTRTITCRLDPAEIIALAALSAVGAVLPTLDTGEFPARPAIEGTSTSVPARTLESLAVVAGCASTEPTRPLLNGVLFTPEEGGHLIATNGRLLAKTPAVVPSEKFILPNAAAHVLAHPDFTGRGAEVTLPQVPEDLRAAFRSGNHLLITNTIAGNYPNFREAIPADVPELVTIAGERRPAVIAWLRGLPDSGGALHLTWETRGQLTLTQRSASNAAVLRVPVEIQGNPPLIAFNPRLLADALEIGSTLCLRDSLTPGICRHPGGRFCVIMPMRSEFTPEEVARSTRPTAEHAA